MRGRSWQADLIQDPFPTCTCQDSLLLLLLHPTPFVLFALLAQSAGLLSLSFKQLSLSLIQPHSLSIPDFHLRNIFVIVSSGKAFFDSSARLVFALLPDAHFRFGRLRTQDKEKKQGRQTKI
jgi:hypothetical protein